MTAPETVTPMGGALYVGEQYLRFLLGLPATVQIAFVEASSSPACVRVGLIGIPAEALGDQTPLEMIQGQADGADWPVVSRDWPLRGDS